MRSAIPSDTFRCQECTGVHLRPPYWTDETSAVELCSPDCAERAADPSPR